MSDSIISFLALHILQPTHSAEVVAMLLDGTRPEDVKCVLNIDSGKWESAKLEAERRFEEAAASGIELVSIVDSKYPVLLRSSKYAVVCLYMQGEYGIPETSCAVIGARNVSADSLTTIQASSASLVKQGISVISGGARGSDTAAHMSAYDSYGTATPATAIVLPHGINFAPKWASQIPANKVTLISQFHPSKNLSGNNQYFMRNNLIAGMSAGMLAAEPKLDGKGGTAYTVRAMQSLNRPVSIIRNGVLAEGSHWRGLVTACEKS